MPAVPDPKLLHGRWLHSHEEDSPGKQVFRPASAPLPPSRGRTAYEFGPGGRLGTAGPGPADRSATAQGTWSLDPQGRLSIQVPGSPPKELQIESLTADRLVVRAP